MSTLINLMMLWLCICHWKKSWTMVESRWCWKGEQWFEVDTQKLIHTPFGTGLILPATQLHAGHCGEKMMCNFMQSLLTLNGREADYVHFTNALKQDMVLTKDAFVKNSMNFKIRKTWLKKWMKPLQIAIATITQVIQFSNIEVQKI